MKIREYAEVLSVQDTDMLVIDREGVGTRITSITALANKFSQTAQINTAVTNITNNIVAGAPSEHNTLKKISNVINSITDNINNLSSRLNTVANTVANKADLSTVTQSINSLSTSLTNQFNAKLTDGSVTKVGKYSLGTSYRPIHLVSGVPTEGTGVVSRESEDFFLAQITFAGLNTDVPTASISNFGASVDLLNKLRQTNAVKYGGQVPPGNPVNGVIRLYEARSKYYTQLVAKSYAGNNQDPNAQTPLSANRTIRMPNASGTLALDSSSSRRVKENIRDIKDEEALKLLDIEVVKFDYIEPFGEKDQCGVIAEDVKAIIPEAVEIQPVYDETKPVDEEINPAPSVDYRKFIPYLIKMVQIQQKEIEELKKSNGE